MIITAKFSSRCACGGQINEGDRVEWERGSKAHCLNCSAAVAVAELPQNVTPIRSWSPLQQAVFDFVLDPERGNLIVIAVAGSGKTTTMVEAARRTRAAHPQASVEMVAFNRDIADELQKRVQGTGVSAGTFHSLCNSSLQRYVKQQTGAYPKLDENKIRRIARDLVRLRTCDRETAELYLAGAIKLAQTAKGAGVGVVIPNDVAAWVRLIDRFEIEFDGPEESEGIALAQQLLELNNADLTTVDFDDMLYLTALFNVKVQTFDYLFIDEAQDFNGIQRFLVHRMLTENSKLIAVGDPFQSIYGFRGADFDSMEQIKSEFACAELPLSISYRCPQSVVELAQTIVNHIQPADTAPAGEVETLEFWRLADFEGSDVVLCRNTAPLVGLAYKCIGARIPCTVLGRDIGKGLVTLINKMRAVDLQDLFERLDAYRKVEVERLNARMEEQKAAALEDRIDSVFAAIANLTGERSIENLIREIEDLFSDRASGVLTLSTIHRAKGKEWKRVFILNPQLMPSMHAKTEEQIAQEYHCMYVAYTRAQETLYFVDSTTIG